MKQKTEQEALIALTALCASGEHCSQEMIDKMTRWDLPEEAQARVI
jgi:regulatory protein